MIGPAKSESDTTTRKQVKDMPQNVAELLATEVMPPQKSVEEKRGSQKCGKSPKTFGVPAALSALWSCLANGSGWLTLPFCARCSAVCLIPGLKGTD